MLYFIHLVLPFHLTEDTRRKCRIFVSYHFLLWLCMENILTSLKHDCLKSRDDNCLESSQDSVYESSIEPASNRCQTQMSKMRKRWGMFRCLLPDTYGGVAKECYLGHLCFWRICPWLTTLPMYISTKRPSYMYWLCVSEACWNFPFSVCVCVCVWLKPWYAFRMSSPVTRTCSAVCRCRRGQDGEVWFWAFGVAVWSEHVSFVSNAYRKFRVEWLP